MDFTWKNKATEIIDELKKSRSKKIKKQWAKNRRY